MSSRPSSARAVEIPSSCYRPSGAARFVLKSPTTSSAAPWGRLPMAATTYSMGKEFFGAK